MTTHSLLAQLSSLTPENATLPARRAIVRRARALGRCDLLPAWLYAPPLNDVTPAASADPNAICARVAPILQAKIAAHAPTRATLAHVQIVYLRGLRAAPAPDTTPIPPEQHAQARVNTFLAYLDGDPAASPQDADLVATHSAAALR